MYLLSYQQQIFNDQMDFYKRMLNNYWLEK